MANIITNPNGTIYNGSITFNDIATFSTIDTVNSITLGTSGTSQSLNLFSAGSGGTTGGQFGICDGANTYFTGTNTNDIIIRNSDVTKFIHMGVGENTTPKLRVDNSGVTIPSGNLTVSTGNLSTTSGTISTTSGNISTTSGTISTASGDITIGTSNTNPYSFNLITAGSPGGQFGYAFGATNYSLSAAAGDVVIRNGDSTKKIHLLAGNGNAIISASNTGVDLTSPNIISGNLTTVNSDIIIGTSNTNPQAFALVTAGSPGGQFGYAFGAGQYSSSATAGDVVIRNGDSTKKIHLQSGGGNSILAVSNTGVDITSPTITSGDLTVNTGNITITSGDLTLSSGVIYAPSIRLGGVTSQLLSRYRDGSFGLTWSGAFTTGTNVQYIVIGRSVSLFFYSISANITSSNSPITATLDNGTFPFLDFGSTVPVFTVSTFDNTTNLGIGIMEFKTVLGVSTVTIWKQVSGGIRGGFVNSGGVQTGGIDPICITYPDTP